MAAYDKLRILWIDDREADDPTYQYPEPELPATYQPYFTIIRHPQGGLSSVRSPREFSDLFGPFWAGVDRRSFPAEIIAMDYVLTKWAAEKVRDRPDRTVEDHLFDQMDRDNRSAGFQVDVPKGTDGQIVGFEGLLIGVFYASLTCDYPAGLVPMTHYGNLMESANEVRALHAMSKPLLDIDYSNFGVSGADRSWRNVLSQGLKSLRCRIISLFLRRRIILSLADIVALKDNPDEAVLTIRSSYGTRRLPVAGLFADVADPSERVRQVITWSEELLTEAGDEDPFEAIAEARSVAEAHWLRYLKDSDVIEERWRLSELCASRKHANACLDDSELARLEARFEVSGPAKPPERMWEGWSISRKNRIITICDDSADGLVLRWASVFVLARLIAHLIRAQSKLSSKSGGGSGSCFSHFSSRDWLYALMPAPDTPLILPAHHKGRNNPASAGGTLNRKLRRLNSAHLPTTGDDNIGNCGFDCEHVFAGRSKSGNDLGLRPVERRLLEAAVTDHLMEAGLADEEIEEFRAKLPLSARVILQGAQP